MNAALNKEVKKLQVEEIVLFAINNIPEIDTTTLKQFLDLVNAGGTFGTISHEQIIKKMHMVLQYIPGACINSLFILTDLLEIDLPAQPLLNAPNSNRIGSGATNTEAMVFFVEAPQTMATAR